MRLSLVTGFLVCAVFLAASTAHAGKQHCDDPNGSDCVEKADTLEHKDNATDADITAARAYYQLACDKGNGEGCRGLFEYAKRDNNRDETKLSAMLLTACNAKLGTPCALLADRYAEGKGIAKDHGKEVAARGVSCESYIWNDCKIVQTLAKSPKEKAAAALLAGWSKACKAGDSAKCDIAKPR